MEARPTPPSISMLRILHADCASHKQRAPLHVDLEPTSTKVWLQYRPGESLARVTILNITNL